ncbi:GGDEF domain-containing protein [Thalassotalea sp. M1531]|uniref:diguanylate cyclase n=1 Tax=Thalassotalea algicola TaxID=2716224 RepID=A0A7Y0L9N3_9GAMM|nr:diguanylate cyclase [Thalassotalea algicola]NMP30209.1 GGDEF domain-containing protein [Thalassotalea algicola]
MSKVKLWAIWIICIFFSLPLYAQNAIEVGGNEQGLKRTGQQAVYHDATNALSLVEVAQLLNEGQFKPLSSAGSTGLKKGAFWSSIVITNTFSIPNDIFLEYIDHQIIHIDLYIKDKLSGKYQLVHQLSLTKPFIHRPVRSHRFTLPLNFSANETQEILVRFGSDEAGFTYPSMRIWTADNFYEAQTGEASFISFLFGSFFLMSLFALVAGVVTRQEVFYYYSIYAFSKITCWATILGFTHQYILRENFHWSLMSTSGAITIICGLLFSRAFLKSKQFTPKLDKVLLLMLANALLLLISALFQIKVIAIITITVALLLYPVLIGVGFARWRQGSKEAGIYSIAWSFLVIGLIIQALRDLGVVEHNFINYYWPPAASLLEMLTIMFAMSMMVNRLRKEKNAAKASYQAHLEQSKALLEMEVKARTMELEQAKSIAEQEARKDPLTGIHNRRSFFERAEERLKLAQRSQQRCCLFVIDLDHFKQINDSMGHGAGDQALCTFTEIVNRRVRETDVFGRLGGEEFALLVTEGLSTAKLVGERLVSDIASEKITVNDTSFSISASIGLVEVNIEYGIELAIKTADEAMYMAKRSGRNRVMIGQY